jgi:hypothetical protein
MVLPLLPLSATAKIFGRRCCLILGQARRVENKCIGIAAETRYDAGPANAIAQPRGHLSEQRIVNRMPERIVDISADVPEAQAVLEAISDALEDQAVGTIGEIFDGDPPHHPRGAPVQAWSVACTLDAWPLLKQAEETNVGMFQWHAIAKRPERSR